MRTIAAGISRLLRSNDGVALVRPLAETVESRSSLRPTHAWRILAIFLAAVLFGSPQRAAAEASAFSIDTAALSIKPDDPGKSAVFSLTLTGDMAKFDHELAVKDGGPQSPDVNVEFKPSPPNIRGNSRTWIVEAKIIKMPADDSLSRYLIATYGPLQEHLRYTLSNRSSEKFSWNVTPTQPARRWNVSDPLSFNVVVGPIPASNVQLLPSTFMEAETLEPLPGGFQLCRSADEACTGEPLSLAANQAHALVIKPLNIGSPTPGEYDGTFSLVANEKPEGNSFPAKLHISDLTRRWIGVGLIVLGILAAFFVNYIVQQRNERNVRLMPAAVLAEQVAGLRRQHSRVAELASLPFPTTAKHLDDLETDLSIGRLKARGFVGGSIPLLRPATAPSGAETYQQFLTRIDSLVALLAIAINSGLAQAAAALRPGMSNAARKIVTDAMADMDGMLATSLPTKDALATTLQTRLKTMQTALAAEQGTQGDAVSDQAPVVGYSSEKIAFDIAAVNLTGWAIFMVLSTLVGSYVLIMSDPDFGQFKDFLMCLLWGFGIPAAGAQLSSLSSPGIAQSFGITLTRA
jgi:hypothetical protein